MIIDKVQIGAEGLSRQDKTDITAEQKTQVADKSAALEGTSGDKVSVSEIWGNVARNIDVRGATPLQIIALSKQLYDGGAISYDDHLNLSFQPEVNGDSFGDSKAFSHEAKDYLALWQHRQDNVLRFGGDRRQIEETHRIQAILTYVDSLR